MNKFEIVSGKFNNNLIEKEKNAGAAIFKENENLYKLHLNIFPNITYFMQKNQGNELFTIFSRIVREDGRTKLLKPVGHGRILKNLKTHLMLNFEVINTNLYMSLFPQN